MDPITHCRLKSMEFLSMSCNSSGTSSLSKNKVEGEVIDLRPTGCVYDLPIQKIYGILFIDLGMAARWGNRTGL